MGRLRGEQGQAANEYAALLAIVAIALAALVGISASGIGSGLLAGLQRGICAVAPGPCPRLVASVDDLDACPVEKTNRKERLGETIAMVELGSSGTLSAVRSSDGSVTVTLADGSDVGAVFQFGAEAAAGGKAGAVARAGAGVDWGSGRSWSFPDAAAAADFVARFGDKATIRGKLVDDVRSACSLLCDALGWSPHEQLPEPDEVFEQGGGNAKLLLSFGLGGKPSEAVASAGGVIGHRTSRDGSSTWYVELSADATGQLELPASGLDLAGGGQAVLAYELGPNGERRALRVSVAGAASGKAGVAGTVGGRGTRSAGGSRAGSAGRGAGSTKSANGGANELRGGVVELEATLDLTDPANEAVAAAVIDTLRDPGSYRQLPAAVRALGARLAEDSQIDVRAYSKRSSATEYGARVSLGVGLGGSFQRSSDSLQLITALTRLPGLPFLPRDDCRAA
ncbi:hypothetical protein [Conexibacter sp. CPCC 206217]|uniref:hypothetical protein n=1 Tax=Conexibacter sp. CPCC 206217 TaxID=3064574 RepID=UPI00271D987F|nr:hypothetical protein [Conexibacter sp. CPCC 206217]MDO8214048.1 hypothetical protein [Conexibacter sp. CPCC 206217]